MRTSRLLAGLVALALGSAGAPAAAAAQDAAPAAPVAERLKVGNPEAMAIAFKEICVDHAGDANAQAAAATAAPWGFTRDGKGKGSNGDYSLFLANLNIGKVGDKLACALTSAVEGEGAGFDPMTANAQKLLVLGEPERTGKDTAKWVAGPKLIFLKVASGKPFTIAVYGLFTPKAGK